MIPSELIEIYMERFCNRSDTWARQVVRGKDCEYFWQKLNQDYYPYRPLDASLIADMFAGKVTLGLPAVGANWCSRWIAWDDDEDNGVADRLQNFLVENGWHALREARRPSRGGHVWLLLNQPLPAQELLWFGDAVLEFLGLEKEVDIEQFPKYAQKLSSLRAPLSVHKKPGAENCRGLFEACPSEDIHEQLLWLADQPLNRAEDVRREALLHKPAPKPPVVYPARRNRAASAGSYCVPILQLVQQPKRLGKEFAAPCPLCRAEGHDRHGDNLRISADGQRFCCVFGGPSKVHRAAEIIRSLTS